MPHLDGFKVEIISIRSCFKQRQIPLMEMWLVGNRYQKFKTELSAFSNAFKILESFLKTAK
jgi:hypothetical protein